jgi:hypothetical protein
MVNLKPSPAPRQPKAPAPHRRTYEAAGQLWPTNLAKHLRRAELPESAFTAVLSADKQGRRAAA